MSDTPLPKQEEPVAPIGTFTCPICGKDEPHYHTQEERQRTVVVAWLCELAQVVTQTKEGNTWSDWRLSLTFNRPDAPDGSIRNLRALYTVPASANEIHRAMLTRIEQLMDADKDTSAGRELLALTAACEAYEEETEPWSKVTRPSLDARMREALERAADGELFTQAELDAVTQIYRDVVAYVEKCGHQLTGAVAAGVQYTVHEKAILLLTMRTKKLLSTLSSPVQSGKAPP